MPKAYHLIALEKIIALPQQATARSALGDHIPEGQISLIFKNVKKRLSSCGMMWQTKNQKDQAQFRQSDFYFSLVLDLKEYSSPKSFS